MLTQHSSDPMQHPETRPIKNAHRPKTLGQGTGATKRRMRATLPRQAFLPEPTGGTRGLSGRVEAIQQVADR